MISAVDGLLLGQMSEHLDAKAAVQVVYNPLLPGTPNDLRSEAARDARLSHDVVGKLPGAVQELIPRHRFIDESVLQGLLGANRLAREQTIGSPLDAQQLHEAAVNTVSGNGADVIVKIENDGIFATNGDVAHEANFRVKARSIQYTDGRNFQIVDK